jgi:hypothetical protein
VATLTGSIPLSSAISAQPGTRIVSVPVIATLVMLVGSSVLLFARLGTYSLWTDEASTAITAAGVWRTGDTSAWLDDHNLLTYRDGLLLNHQKDRYTSPLQFYVAAPFIGLLGHSSLACRLPFALCGLGTVMVILCWLRQAKPGNGVWIAATLVVLTNASFFLFQRQCRYYALATFLSTVVAYLYCHWNGRRRQLVFLAIAMSLLLCSQYLDYAAVVGCLVIDYGIWGRRRKPIRGKNWLFLIGPQMVTAMLVCRIWNPIERAASVVAVSSAKSQEIAATTSHAWLHGFVTLLWWNIRDLIACDFVILPLLILCPILYFRTRNTWLLRAPLALLIFVGGVVFFTAHPLPPAGNAEVRYLAPAIPLCIAVGVLAFWGLFTDGGSEKLRSTGFPAPRSSPSAYLRTNAWNLSTAVILGLVLYCIFGPGSTALAYFSELQHPCTEPYTPVAGWINQNIPARATVYIAPDMCVSPIMWDAPGPTYVWQLNAPAKADYANLPGIYFKYRVAPDYLIAFGPDLSAVHDCQSRFASAGIQYQSVATIPVYYKEMFRPELIWRSFTTIQPKPDEQVYVFKRQ